MGHDPIGHRHHEILTLHKRTRSAPTTTSWRPVRDSNSCYRRERAVSWASRRTGQAGKRRDAHNGRGRRWVADPVAQGSSVLVDIGSHASGDVGYHESTRQPMPFHSSARKCPARCSGAPSERASNASGNRTRRAPGTTSPSTVAHRPHPPRTRGSSRLRGPTRSARTTRARDQHEESAPRSPLPNGARRVDVHLRDFGSSRPLTVSVRFLDQIRSAASGSAVAAARRSSRKAWKSILCVPPASANPAAIAWPPPVSRMPA